VPDQKWLECKHCRQAIVPIVVDVEPGKNVRLYHNEPTLDMDHDPDVSQMTHVLVMPGQVRLTLLLTEALNLRAAGMVESPVTVDHWLAEWQAVPGEPDAAQMLGLMRGEGR
jgi:hypothetical protein